MCRVRNDLSHQLRIKLRYMVLSRSAEGIQHDGCHILLFNKNLSEPLVKLIGACYTQCGVGPLQIRHGSDLGGAVGYELSQIHI